MYARHPTYVLRWAATGNAVVDQMKCSMKVEQKDINDTTQQCAVTNSQVQLNALSSQGSKQQKFMSSERQSEQILIQVCVYVYI